MVQIGDTVTMKHNNKEIVVSHVAPNGDIKGMFEGRLTGVQKRRYKTAAETQMPKLAKEAETKRLEIEAAKAAEAETISAGDGGSSVTIDEPAED